MSIVTQIEQAIHHLRQVCSPASWERAHNVLTIQLGYLSAAALHRAMQESAQRYGSSRGDFTSPPIYNVNGARFMGLTLKVNSSIGPEEIRIV